ncbi:hypothetical protein KP509_1Z194700 [Ceratopteris richardii]|nr:hypothetical protein KP509_1Z194700 [Ceratopteris richardii]
MTTLKSSLLLNLLVLVVGVVVNVVADEPAQKTAESGGRPASSLRPGFQPNGPKVTSSSMDHTNQVGSDNALLGDAKFECPCSNQLCDGSSYQYCTCVISSCSCICHN